MLFRLVTCFGLVFLVTHLFAQNSTSANTSITENNVPTISDYYKLAVQYKDGIGVPMDYRKAYENFSKAAALGDPQSVYAVGYMTYKGLGCNQDYKKAADLFFKVRLLKR